MATIPWTEEEDITLCDASRGSKRLATTRHVITRVVRFGENFPTLLHPYGDTTQTVDTLSSHFRTIHLDSERFEMVHTAMENADGDHGEDEIIQVALINFRHEYNREFKYVSVWQIIRFFFI
ncbi:hypothetical protein Hanom_Chr04g00320401 [Helianthus anomalus]